MDYIISKLKKSGLVTQQGGAEGQGLWCNFSNIKDYLTPIKSVEDLDNFVK